MNTDFVDNLREYALNMFDCEIELSSTCDVVYIYFCTIYIDFKKNKVALELKEDSFATEIFYLTRFLCEEGMESQLILSQNSNWNNYDEPMEATSVDIENFEDYDDTEGVAEEKKSEFLVVTTQVDRKFLKLPFQVDVRPDATYITNTRIRFSCN